MPSIQKTPPLKYGGLKVFKEVKSWRVVFVRNVTTRERLYRVANGAGGARAHNPSAGKNPLVTVNTVALGG